MNKQERKQRLLPDGKPRYIRCYDNGGTEHGGTIDQYTVVFTGRYRHKTGGEFWVLGMNSCPFHPQGFGQHMSYPYQIDRPKYGHLGKKISFDELPPDCQKAVLTDYKEIWNLN